MIKKHYLDHQSKEEGQAFFSIVPNATQTEAISQETKPVEENQQHLKAV